MLVKKAWKNSKGILKPSIPTEMTLAGHVETNGSVILPLDHVLVSKRTSENTDLDTISSEVSTACSSESGSQGLATKSLLLTNSNQYSGWRKFVSVIQKWYDVVIWLSTFLSVILLDVGTAIYIGLGIVILFKLADWVAGSTIKN